MSRFFVVSSCMYENFKSRTCIDSLVSRRRLDQTAHTCVTCVVHACSTVVAEPEEIPGKIDSEAG